MYIASLFAKFINCNQNHNQKQPKPVKFDPPNPNEKKMLS